MSSMFLLKTDNNAYELCPNYIPRPPLPRKVGGHDPLAPMGAPPLSGNK